MQGPIFGKGLAMNEKESSRISQLSAHIEALIHKNSALRMELNEQRERADRAEFFLRTSHGPALLIALAAAMASGMIVGLWL